ncbi:MAG TPA: hypothetical protein VNX69_13060 [Steroidobacteraceae bacterium]|jgi:hypothetical protein|nr:hypothetical protein [Steroidobacteraceae bacterium]
MADPEKYVFIVTGGKIGETLDFSPMARACMVELVIKWNGKPEFDLPAKVNFIHFDFETNKVSVYQHAFPKGIKGTQPSLKNSDWKELADARTDFKDIDISTHDNNINSTKTLSITNVYGSIRKAPVGSVLDVSIFSHAYVKGPVLVDTSDTEAKAGGSSNRTPKDMDGRARTDFNANMGEAAAGDGALAEFVARFDPKGHFRVFGCNVQDVVPLDVVAEIRYMQAAVFQVVFQAFGKPIRGSSDLGNKLRKNQQPTDSLTLDMWEAMMNEAEKDANSTAKKDPTKPKWSAMNTAQRNTAANKLLALHEHLDPFFYPSPSSDSNKPPPTQTISRLWDDIIALVTRKISECYIFKAAEALASHGVVCHGAPPGVGGNNEKDPRLLGLMRVCAGNEKAGLGCDDSYASWLRFYKNFYFSDRQTHRPLDDSFDERNYARYDKKSVELVHNSQ